MGDYIQAMRKLISHEALFTVGCGAIIENSVGQILLQHRKDHAAWGIPGGVMELGETFLETLIREVKEETDMTLYNPQLFGIYSGPSGFGQYPNGDKVYSVQIVFLVKEFEGIPRQEGEESFAHAFFERTALPFNLNPSQAPFIVDWAEGNHLNNIIVK